MSSAQNRQVFFTLCQIIADYVLVIWSAILAYQARSWPGITQFRPVMYGDEFSLNSVMSLSWRAALIWIGVFMIIGLYRSNTASSASKTFRQVFLGTTISLSLILAYFFFTREFFNSRFLLIGFWILSTVFVLINHGIFSYWRKKDLARGYGVNRVLLLSVNSKSDEAQHWQTWFESHPELGFKIMANLSLTEALTSPLKWDDFDTIILTDQNQSSDTISQLNELANNHQLALIYAADQLNARAENMFIRTYDSVPFIHFRQTPLEGWWAVAKRTLDLILALVCLPFFAIIYLIIGFLIKRESPGPILVKLPRVGQRGRIFTLFKFRSMIDGADKLKSDLLAANERADGPLFKLTSDPRVTKIGHWLRVTSLDELPQILNVINGTMSFVGPRPHEPNEVNQYSKTQKKVLTIKPGITGLAQISGRSSLSFIEENRLDTYYLESWSLSLDAYIFWQTPWVLIKREHAV